MDETDSRSSTLAADRGLCRRDRLLRKEDRAVVRQLVEAAVRHHISWLNTDDRSVAAIRHAGLHRLLHDVVERPLGLCAARSASLCTAFKPAPASRLPAALPCRLP